MKMPPAITPLEALSVPAIVVLMEMESTAQVRLAIFSLFSWLKSKVIVTKAHLCSIYYVNTVKCFVFVVVVLGCHS